MFALAMLLPIVYSNMGTAQEGFENHHDNSYVVSEEDDNVYEEDTNANSDTYPMQSSEAFSFTA